MMTLSEQISEFITRFDLDTIPEAVIVRAHLHLLDTLGVAIAGTRQAAAVNARCVLSTLAKAPSHCHVWASSITLSPEYAVLANGIAAHALDFDDTHTDSITHGSAILVPLVMALSEDMNLSGKEMLSAYIIGWEVAARVGLASQGSFHKRGFHTTPVAGIFGAASAASRLLGLSAQECAHAIGLAGSQASGVAEYLSNSSSSKCFHAGWAAHSAILAARLAQAGMTGPLTIFEGRFGLFMTHGLHHSSVPGQIGRGLGQRWELLNVSIKPYPCCHFAHASVDCVRMLRHDGIAPEDIVEIQCVVDPVAGALICEPAETKITPGTPYAAKFSLPWLAATGMLDDGLSLRSFDATELDRPEVLALAEKISFRYCEEGEIPFPEYFPGRIIVTLTDGREVTKRLDINYGHPENPMLPGDVERKFRDNVNGILKPRAADRIIDLVNSLDNNPIIELSEQLSDIINLNDGSR
ncbi:MmgE/PrpD family protein [Edwardsiella anguillarum]|uniref:MmgE/PrpD family protein n=1 Tax=Edwardsiella anguillarum TaxID=1821960 RepID=UPI0024B6C19B|nr:MmgE/PrpD family protein [Edwardsiella anguillarum]WHQ15897.1 MmgE/PrpD family protein [Edwardsiella anguillarum]